VNNIFATISYPGIIEPGQLYILDEHKGREYRALPIEELFFIRDERELLQALYLEFFVVGSDDYEVLEYLGMRKINKECYEFSIKYNEIRFDEEYIYTLYLHRIQTFAEYVARTEELQK
jgi:hypothetical protein